MKQAINHFVKLTRSEKEKLWAEQRQKSDWIWQGRLEQARNEGLSKGVKQGVKQGVRQGVKQGLQKVASKMLQKKMPASVVAEITNLPEKEIKKLQELLVNVKG